MSKFDVFKRKEQRFDCLTGKPSYTLVSITIRENEERTVAIMIGEDDKAERDAILLSAAPELLEALKGAFSCLNQRGQFPADISFAKKILLDAIAKTEGKL